MQKIYIPLAGMIIGFCSAPYAQAAEMVKADLKPCLHDGTSIGGVNSCGKVWKLKSGQARLGAQGELTVEVQGLVLNDPSTGDSNGTPDGVDALAAAVVCDGKVAGQAEPVLLPKSGDATIKAKLSVPADCKSPVVILRERYEGKIGGWLAEAGK